MAQFELFNEAPKVSAAPSADLVRARLEAIFATLRGPGKVADSEIRSLRLVVPQMAQWLPETERGAVIAEFNRLVDADLVNAASPGRQAFRLR